MIEWSCNPDKSMCNGSVQGSWEYRIRNYGGTVWNVSVWNTKESGWVLSSEFDTLEDAKQWCEMYEATGARN